MMARLNMYIFTVLIAIISVVAIYESITGSYTGVCSKAISDEVALGSNLSEEFGRELNRDNLCMFAGEVNLQGDSANTKEILVLNHMGKDAGPATALTSNKEYDDVVLEIERGSIKLYYIFDNSIDLARASLDHPMETKFLGKSFKLARADSSTSFLAYVGDEYQLYLGNQVVVNNKTVQLLKVGQNGAVMVSVDGEEELLSRGSTETINGIEITNVESFYDSENMLNNLAELIIGGEALVSVKDGDFYPGSKDWLWSVGGLTTATSTTTSSTSKFSGPFIGIENYFEYDRKEDTVTEGECVLMPHKYISVCFNGTTSEDYVELRVDTGAVDLTELGGGSSESGVHFKMSDNALKVDGTRTDEAWIVNNLLYYKRGDRVVQAGFDGTNIGTIEKLSITKAGNLYTVKSPVANDDITFTYTTSLGVLQWNSRNVKDSEGKLVTKYGTVIKDKDDELELEVPDDQVRGVVSISSSSS